MPAPFQPTGNEIYFPAYNHTEAILAWPTPDYYVINGYGYWSCSLVKGSVGEGVRALQENLNFCYSAVIGPRLDEDGRFGSLTKAALVRVQQYHAITADGEYGPQSARTIYHRMADRSGGEWCATLAQAGWPGNSG